MERFDKGELLNRIVIKLCVGEKIGKGWENSVKFKEVFVLDYFINVFNILNYF